VCVSGAGMEHRPHTCWTSVLPQNQTVAHPLLRSSSLDMLTPSHGHGSHLTLVCSTDIFKPQTPARAVFRHPSDHHKSLTHTMPTKQLLSPVTPFRVPGLAPSRLFSPQQLLSHEAHTSDSHCEW
jgi:hypothetical protein